MYMKHRKADDSGKAMKDLLHRLEKKKAERFVDEDFPANDKSVGRGMRNVVWLRASEFTEGEPKLFCDGITPDDIRQGELGDCYFLSSLSVLAEKPERIKELFCNHVDNKFGAYCVTMHCDGLRSDVILDDMFPCDVKTRKPVFSHGNGPELWVLLLEKAYAKLHGSYKNIENGNAAAALSDLTGGPCFIGKVAEQSDDEIWSTLTLHDRLDHVMCCSVTDDPNRDLEKEVGLVEKHAYALLDAREYRGNRLLHVRNPWGKTEWKGKWGDSDTASWTADAKRALHYVDADDGSFWIALEDWKRYFENYTVLILEDGWEFSSASITVKNQVNYYSLTTEEQTDLFITAHLTDSDIGSRICILGAKKPYFALGGSKEAFMASSVVSSDRIRLPKGKFLVVYEVFKDHASKLPFMASISTYSTSDSITLSQQLDEEQTAASKVTGFSLPSFEKKFGLCSTCGAALNPTHFTVKGKKFHKYCMQCYFCGTKLTSSVSFKDDQIACKECASGKKKIEGEPAGAKMLEETKKQREELDKERIPKMPEIIARRRETEAEQAKAKPISADEIDLKKLCKEQKKSAKKVRKHITDADIRRVFSMVDVDGSGSVESKEIDDLIVVLGLPLSIIPKVKELQMQFIMSDLDADGSGEVDFKEFRNWFKQTDMKLYSKRMTNVEMSGIYFLSFCKDGKQEVEGDAIKSLHEALVKEKLTKSKYDDFVKAIDGDKSGSISFPEFISWMDQQCRISLFHK